MNSLNYFLNLFYPIIINMIMLMMISFPLNKNIHPLIFSLILTLYVILMSLNMFIISFSWMPFFIFLIVVGGLMIIFLYITSLTNNEMFKFEVKNLNNMLMKMFLLFIILISMKNYNYISFFDLTWNNYILNLNKNNLMISLNYNYFNNSLFFLMIYLLYALLSIMNICYLFNLPLRQYNYYE
nr:NADH deshydrogenase subunit 6 [Euceros kiushuensis]